MIQLTQEQIIEEFEKALEVSKQHQDTDAFTHKELQALLGMSANSVYDRLAVLDGAGRLECVSKSIETRAVGMNGKRVWRHVTAYRLLPEKKAESQEK